MIAIADGKNILVKFKYDRSLVEFMHEFYPRKFNRTEKVWKILDTKENRTKLKNRGFDLTVSEKTVPITKISYPKKTLPFQIEGIKAMVKNRKVLNADDMGLGKSIQSLVAIHNLKAYPCLIVCPATLKFNWEIEIDKWILDKSVYIVSGKSNKVIPKADFVIINYDIFAANLELLLKIGFKGLILDEAHAIKSEKTKRTKAIIKFVKNTKLEAFFALTGTPILNKPIEIYNALNLLRPDVYNNKWHFAKHFCGLWHNGFGWVMDGATNTDELHKLLSATVMIRRTKNEVLKELPDKVRTIIPVEILNKREYQFAFNNFVSWLMKKENRILTGAETLVKIEKLKQLVIKGKMKQVFEWVDEYLETGQKLVVFATHTKTIDNFTGRYKGKIVKIDGSVTGENRKQAVEQFQNNSKIRLIIGNIKAMGTGITLTASSTVLFVELGWTPAEHDQAEDRVHRIGQKESVNIYYIVGKETIEEDILELLDRKREIITKVIDGKEVDFKLLDELLKKYKGKK